MAWLLQRRFTLAWIALWIAIATMGCAAPDQRVDVVSEIATDAAIDVVTSGDVSIDRADAPTSNAQCEFPTRVAPGTTLTNESTAGSTVTTITCLANFSGPMRFYSIAVAPAHALDVTATAAGSTLPVAVRFFDDCEGTCIDSGPGAAQWINRTLVTKNVIVAIGSRDAEPVVFDASFSTRPVVVGESCALAIDVTETTSARVDLPASAPSSRQCDGSTAAARWFRVRIPAVYELLARVTGSNDVQLRVSESCSSATCIARERDSISLGRASGERVVFLSATPASSTSFNIEFELTPAPVPGVCAESAVYRTTTVLTRQPFSLASDNASNCELRAIPAVFYRVVVPVGRRLTATSTTNDVQLRLLESCSSSACAGTRNTVWPNTRARYINESLSEQTITVAVSPGSGTQSETFDLTLALDTPPRFASCSAAPIETPGIVSGLLQEAALTAQRCDVSARSRAIFFNVDVPAGRRLQVIGQRETGVSLFDACGSSMCLGNYWREDSQSMNATWTNSSASTRRLVLALYSYSGLEPTTAVGATISLDSPPPESTCASAPLLATPATVLRATTTNSEQGLSCDGASPSQAALWWRVRVPAGQRVEASLESVPFGSGQALAFVAACGLSSCLAVGRSGLSSSAEAAWTNQDAVDRTIYLVAFGAIFPFDLSVRITTPVPESTCAGRVTLTPDIELRRQRFADASERSPTCPSTAGPPTPALYYSVAVPAGQRLDVRVASQGAPHLVRIREACGAGECLATAFAALSDPTTTTTRWINTDTVERSVVVAVSRFDGAGGTSGTFDIRASMVSPPANVRCTTALPLISGVPVSGTTEFGGARATTCSGSSFDAQYYSITVPAGQRLLARTTSGSPSGAFVRILPSCGAMTCLGTVEAWSAAAHWTNSGASPQDVIIAVGRETSGYLEGPFVLTATLETPAANNRCATPVVVAGSTTLSNQRLIDVGDETGVCRGSTPSLFYAVEVPSNHRLRVRTTSRTMTGTYTSIETRCGGVCLAAADSLHNIALWTNTGSSQNVIVAVGVARGSRVVDATADVEFSIEPIPEAGACASAPLIASGSSRSIQWNNASELMRTCIPSGIPAEYRSLFYAVSVPPGQTLTATLDGVSNARTGIRIVSSCETRVCLSDFRGGMSSIEARWRNPNTTATTVLVVASATDPFATLAPSVLSIDVTM